MKTLRIAFITVVATLAAVLGFGQLAPAGSAAAPTVYTRTIAGTDVHSLDPHLDWIFVPGGGATVTIEPSGANIKYNYLEATIDLPVGAKVTSIAVTYKYCPNPSPGPASYVFGSYLPATRATVQSAVINANPSCSPTTVTKTGNPITTALAGRRYALDWSPYLSSPWPSPNPGEVFYGATIKFTCTSPCVP
jgi:hypothetical protein